MADLMVRKNGLVILKMTELEAVTLTDVMDKVKIASVEQPEFFNRTQKAVINDTVKVLNGLDKAIIDAEKRQSDDGEDAAPAEQEAEKTDKVKAKIGSGDGQQESA